MDENFGVVVRCAFCKHCSADRLPVQTVFGAANVCRSCWTEYREQLQLAIDRLNGQPSAKALNSEKAA